MGRFDSSFMSKDEGSGRNLQVHSWKTHPIKGQGCTKHHHLTKFIGGKFSEGTSTLCLHEVFIALKQRRDSNFVS